MGEIKTNIFRMTHIRAKIGVASKKQRVIWNQQTEMLNISITHKSASGIANYQVIEQLALIFELPKGKVTILKGLDTAYKVIEVDRDLEQVKKLITKYNDELLVIDNNGEVLP
jgi:uncharacterized protein YggU (UPF0235/DUF167 family)